MSDTKNEKLVIAVSSRSIFDQRAEHRIFEQQGLEAFIAHQIENEDEILPKGPGFNLVKKLSGLEVPGVSIEIVMESKNNADTGMRISTSMEHYGLGVLRAAYTAGAPTPPYVKDFGACLYLSSDPNEVERALESGIEAATILDSNTATEESVLRIAFDADAVLFDRGSEAIFQEEGLDAFIENEVKNENVALNPGPFFNFLNAIHNIQSKFSREDNPIRTAIVTARSVPTGKRVNKTLRAAGVRVDECFFLAGQEKGKILKNFGADLFFDDMIQNCDDAREHVATGHVPYIVRN